ncbi:MAG: hypothetical protein WD875_03245 [Pirellulales bacterium]
MIRPLQIVLASTLAAAAIVAAPPHARAAEDATKASTSAAARADAVKAIPLDQLDAQSRATVSDVVKKAGVFRRMPISVVDCDPNLYLFLVRNPEVVVNIWQAMNVTTVSTERVKPGVYRATDGAGTACNIQFVHSSPDTHVILADGAYSGPLFLRPVKARCVLVLKSAYVKETDGRHYVTSRMDTFIDLDSVGLELFAKTVQPLVGKAADHNFTETSGFFGTLSRAAERNSPGIQRLSAKLTKIDPKVRDEFLKHTAAVAQVAQAADQSQGETVIISDVTPNRDQTPKGTPIKQAAANMPPVQR